MSLDVSPECATQVWDDLASRLEHFLLAWGAGGDPPALASHLPDGPEIVRRMILNELIKADLEQRLMRGLFRPLEEYAAEFSELLVDGEPPCDLIYEEFHLRRMNGEQIAAAEYARRFPRGAQQLQALVNMGAPLASVSLQRSQPCRELTAGQRIDDFELLTQLGKGAFATVFLARQSSMQRLVALKVSADRGSEPQALAQLDHPHIVRVYDQRIVSDAGLRLLYMQFAAGGTLQEVVTRARKTPPEQRSGRLVVEVVDEALERTGMSGQEESSARRRLAALPWAETVCRLGAQLGQALDYAHRQGVLHRDVKPANVLLTAEGSPKLADFNISFSAQVQGATPAAYFGGSLAYMSPEQLDACNGKFGCGPEDLDARSDIYSLAVVLWELLHGERPFGSEKLGNRLADTVDDMANRRRQRELDVPPGASQDLVSQRLRTVLRRALSSDPQQRPASGGELARQLYLCTQPRAWDVLYAPSHGLFKWIRQHPILAEAALIMPPNILAAAYNWVLNYEQIIKPLQEQAVRVFMLVQFVLNVVFFSLGVAILILLARPLARTLRQRLQDLPVPEETLAARRRRALLFGHYAAGVGIAEWTAAGLAFPLAMHLGLGYFPASEYVTFLLSMIVCGAVAAAFPFFGATYLGLRAFYPVLLGKAEVGEPERKQILAVVRHAGGYLLIAGGVPLIGLLLLLGSGSQHRWASLVLVVAGIAGLLLAYLAHNALRAQAATLTTALRPADAPLDSESIEV